MSTPRQIEAAAADWLVRRNAGWSPVDETRFQDWMSADSRHAPAFDQLVAAWKLVSFPGVVGQGEVALARLRARERNRVRRQRRLALGTVGLAAAAMVFALRLGGPAGRKEPAEPSIVMLQPERRVLADGSTVELTAGTRIAVAFSSDKRRVQLLSGEALFAVAKDPARPFVVAVNGVEVRAVGTEFDVRFGAKQVDVVVTEGRVAIRRTSDGVNLLGSAGADPGATLPSYHGLQAPLLTAGERAVIAVSPAAPEASTTVSVADISPSDITAALAWRDNRVQFTRAPLSAAVAFFNRHNKVRLSIADPSVAGIPISGNLRADDPEGFVRLLDQGFNVQSSRAGESIVLRLR